MGNRNSTKYFIFYTSGNIPCNLLAGDVEFDVQSNDILLYEQQVSRIIVNACVVFGINSCTFEFIIP